MKLVDLFETLAPSIEQEIIGIRPGEKMHEVLLTEQEARHTVELDNYYVVLPEFLDNTKYEKYFDLGVKSDINFRFTSDTNQDWLSAENLQEMINNLVKNI